MSDDLRPGQVGPCLVHKEYHNLTLVCWKGLRDFLHNCEVSGRNDPRANMAAYRAAVDKSIRK